MQQHKFLLAAVAAATLSTAASAQLGRVTFSIDLEAPTANNLHLGCVYLNGLIYTTNAGLGNVAPHQVQVFDTAGNHIPVLGFDQPATVTASGSAWGYRDGDTDGVVLIFGYEDGIEVVDTAGNPVNQLISANGSQTITQPIVSSGVTTVHRGLAYDPNGNGGNGSIFVGNFGADIEEIALDGTVLNTFLVPTTAWSVYGLALDTGSGTLWVSSSPNAGPIAEFTIDRATPALIPTGRQFDRGQPGTAQGGLDLVEGGLDGRNCGSDLIGVDQGAPDTLYGYRLDLYDGYTSDLEPKLAAGFDGGNNAVDVIVPLTASTIEWTGTSGLPGAPGILVVDLNQAAPLPPGLTGIMELWELTSLGIAQLGINDGTPLSIPAAGFTAAGAGTTFNAQAVMLNTSLPSVCGIGSLPVPLTTSNPVRHIVETPYKVEVRATGTNSFNSVTTEGFFQIEAGSLATADPIVSVEFDWVNSSNPAQSDMEFDCDQINMANTFDEGNGGGCGGTYRNNCDVVCGLDYANPANNLLNTGTCAGSIAHCEATNPVTAPDYRTLKWHFVPGMFTGGKIFEFDIDTDLGAGTAGDDMAGMVVTIVCASGATMTGELAVDPVNANASFIRF